MRKLSFLPMMVLVVGASFACTKKHKGDVYEVCCFGPSGGCGQEFREEYSGDALDRARKEQAARKGIQCRAILHLKESAK